MTSTPVTAGVGAFFPGTQAAAAQQGAGTGSAFSDVLKNQTDAGSRTENAAPEKTRTQTAAGNRVAGNGAARKEDLRTKETDGADSKEVRTGEISPEEAQEQAEAAAQVLAGQMVEQTAQQLGVTEEEVKELLDSLDMTPMNLLNEADLQTVVLAAAGETDATGLVTNEQLFADFKQLSGTLEELTAQTAEATGLSEEEVTQIFTGLAREAEPEKAAEEAFIPLEKEDMTVSEETEEATVSKPVEAQEEIRTEETGQIPDTKTDRPKEGGKENTQNGGSAFRQADSGFQQNFTTQAQTEVMSDVREAQSYFSPDTERIMNQITDYMRAQIREGVSELDMQLHPASLGNLHVKLTAKEGMVTAQFTAQNDTVKTALEGQMIQLKETFKEQGISVEAIEVTVAEHRFDENLQQNSGRESGNGRPARQRTRRINLNMSEDETVLNEEDRLAAEVLADNGGTVDYTA